MASSNAISHYSKEQWAEQTKKCRISKMDINSLIMNYLIIEGYPVTASKFAQETGIMQSSKQDADVFSPATLSGYDTINERVKIKNAIYAGKIDVAIEQIIDLNPELLDTNSKLHFTLLRLELIELIRELFDDDIELNEEQRKMIVKRALDFARTHLAKRALMDPSYLGELELTVALLCFPKELLAPQLKELLDLNLRRKVAEEVNQALLGSHVELANHGATENEANVKRLIKLWVWGEKTLGEKVEFPKLTKDQLA